MRSRRVLLTAVAVFATAVSVSSITRTVRSFYRLDFRVSWVEAGLLVDSENRRVRTLH